jgi:polysaccharide biosynthesis transport protein
VELTQDLDQTLQVKLRQAGIVAGLASANIAVVEPGQLPSEPVDPRPVLDLALGMGAGLGLGLLSALALQALDTTIRTREEAEDITALLALAVIPQIEAGELGSDRKKLKETERPARLRLIAFNKPHSPAAESYRSLRTSLLLCNNGTPPKVLAITSSLPAEGETLTALNCAMVLAQQGSRVFAGRCGFPPALPASGIRNSAGSRPQRPFDRLLQ